MTGDSPEAETPPHPKFGWGGVCIATLVNTKTISLLKNQW